MGIGMPPGFDRRLQTEAKVKADGENVAVSEHLAFPLSSSTGEGRGEGPRRVGSIPTPELREAADLLGVETFNEGKNEPVKDSQFKVNIRSSSSCASTFSKTTDESESSDVVRIHTSSTQISSDRKIQEVGGYTFGALPDAKFLGLRDKKNADMLRKWGVKLHVSKYRFSEAFDRNDASIFLSELISSQEFRKHARRSVRKGHHTPTQTLEGKLRRVIFQELKTTVTNMSFFDRIKDEGLVTSSNKIRGCFDEIMDDVTCNTLLRKALFDENDEHYEIFSDSERSELIFKLFRLLVFGGGGMCQYDDSLTPYINTCKDIYKDMVSVCRNATTGSLEVKTHTYSITDIDGIKLFPEKHDLNACYVCVDTMRRYVTYFYFSWPGQAW
ncbi:hypothetical protein AAMO2058_000453000 [Amorphochlora amoebiformis]